MKRSEEIAAEKNLIRKMDVFKLNETVKQEQQLRDLRDNNSNWDRPKSSTPISTPTTTTPIPQSEQRGGAGAGAVPKLDLLTTEIPISFIRSQSSSTIKTANTVIDNEKYITDSLCKYKLDMVSQWHSINFLIYF